MSSFALSGLAPAGLVLAGAVALAAAPGSARAQQTPDPEDTVYATGALPEDPAALAKRPQTRTFRAFLPERVDLGHRFPPAGHQGKQGSCVGWAVGYAARSYYVSGPGGGGAWAPTGFPARPSSTIRSAGRAPAAIPAAGSATPSIC